MTPRRQPTLARLDAALERLVRAQNSRRAAKERAVRSGVWLSASALAVLADLRRHGPDRLTLIAARTRIELSRASREVRRLADDGLVELAPDPADGRANVVSVTELGNEQWEAYRQLTRDTLAAVVAEWDDGDLVAFTELFDRFTRQAIAWNASANDTGAPALEGVVP